jgi:succinate dehydrogenase flavin-adding protein (antitoxin of CptAB toxin-antitoxin module)
MVKVRRKLVTFRARAPTQRRARITFKSKGRKVSFLARKTTKKKITFYARRG